MKAVLAISDTDLEGLHSLARRLLTKCRCCHLKSSKLSLYLPWKEGERSLVNIHRLCRIQERNIKKYFRSTMESLMTLAVQADKGYTPLN